MNSLIKLAAALALASGAAVATPAAAAPVVYTISGTFSGIYDSHFFTNTAITFTGTSDTDDGYDVFGTTLYSLSSLTATIGSKTLEFKPGMTLAFNNILTAMIGTSFGNQGGGGIGPLLTFRGVPDYDGSTSLDETAPSRALGGTIFTGANFSNFLVFTGKNTTIDALVTETPLPAVPESGTWAMLLIGFGAVGVALRRRRRGVTTTIRFA